MTERSYGWHKSERDDRDYRFSAPPHIVASRPDHVNLRPVCPPIWDQTQLGSCTAFSSGGGYVFSRMKQGLPAETPSFLHIYFNTRVLEGTVDEDSGASVRNAIKALVAQGAPPDADWPYDITKFAQKPPAKAYADGLLDHPVLYQAVPQTIEQMQGCLAQGYPIIIGFSVYSGFESEEVARTGVVHMPAKHEVFLGGHCVEVIGYNEKQKRFYLRNQWGVHWGIQGYFTMPYDYLLDPKLASDFWTIRTVV